MRARLALACLLAATWTGAAQASPHRAAPAGQAIDRPDIVVVLTDDQPLDSLPGSPAAMPWLQSRLTEPGWVTFHRALVNTPLCCPSRATLLSGQYNHHHGVTDNGKATRFDEANALPVWLRAAGYRTALVGKYYNFYPFAGSGHPAHYVPPGWDRWAVIEHPTDRYFDYTLSVDGAPESHGGAPGDYSTDVFAGHAERFIASQPSGQPYFLLLAPNAPHYPMTPAPRHAQAFPGMAPYRPPNFNEADVSDKPAWVRSLPLQPPARQDARRLGTWRALLAVDDAVRRVWEAVAARGELDNTVVVVTSDHGHAFGEHRWQEKNAVYDEVVRVPLAVYLPGAATKTEHRIVSNVDLAPTILALAGATPGKAQDGRSLLPLLTGTPTTWRTDALLSWAGPAQPVPVTGYWAVRSRDWTYSELATGERELYDLRADPYQLANRAGQPAYAQVQADLAARLRALRQ